MRKPYPLIASLLILLVVVWGAARYRQLIFRRKAEALFVDIKSLELQRSTWSDAQMLVTRWGRSGTSNGDCNAPAGCTYRIEIDDWLFDGPEFVYQEGPHIGARILDQVGLRNSRAFAEFNIARGVVTTRTFGMSVTLPFRDWGIPLSYWPSLDASFSEREALGVSDPVSGGMPPLHTLHMRRIRLEALFTPQESMAEQKALMDFRFDCITQWHPCESRAEIMPEAEEQFVEQNR